MGTVAIRLSSGADAVDYLEVIHGQFGIYSEATGPTRSTWTPLRHYREAIRHATTNGNLPPDRSGTTQPSSSDEPAARPTLTLVPAPPSATVRPSGTRRPKRGQIPPAHSSSDSKPDPTGTTNHIRGRRACSAMRTATDTPTARSDGRHVHDRYRRGATATNRCTPFHPRPVVETSTARARSMACPGKNRQRLRACSRSRIALGPTPWMRFSFPRSSGSSSSDV